MKWKVVVKGERVKGSEFGIVDYKRSLSSEVIERRIANHNRKVERDYQRYQVMGMRKGKQ
jgi:hypothetical protein